MPLSAPVLSLAIKQGLLAAPATQAQDNAALTALCDAIAQAVVMHITTNAVVTVAGPTGPLPGTVL